MANKWKNLIQLLVIIISGISGMLLLLLLSFRLVPSAAPSDIIDWIIFLSPFLTLLYATESKLLLYRKNVRYFILASGISTGVTKINKKYRVFFSRKDYTNLLTGEVITFGEVQDIIKPRTNSISNDSED